MLASIVIYMTVVVNGVPTDVVAPTDVYVTPGITCEAFSAKWANDARDHLQIVFGRFSRITAEITEFHYESTCY